MRIKIEDNNGKVIEESVVNSMNHYLMVLNRLKKNTYKIEFSNGSKRHSRTISVK